MSADDETDSAKIPAGGSFPASQRSRVFRKHVPEICGAVFLTGLVAYLLHVSWRRWPDPIVDSGPQWYAAWRISQGGMLFHEILWVYGPLSAYFNGTLFKVFGPSLTVLFTANLIIYAAILCLAYLAFRKAWGWLAAFAACGVFVSIFSFSHLTSTGNYNYAAPYSHESTHGMLLMLLTLFVAARWSTEKSLRYAFLLGLLGGLAAVLKPEFMLGAAVAGLAGLLLRYAQHRPVHAREYLVLVGGIIFPTLAFTALFASTEPVTSAFAHASNAWWLVLVKPSGPGGLQSISYLNGLVGFFPAIKDWQQQLAGLDHPWQNALLQIQSGATAALVIAALWGAGWLANRASRTAGILALLVLAFGLLTLVPWESGWSWAGRCLPLLLVAVLALVCIRLARRLRDGELAAGLVMQSMLVLLATCLLMRMALFSRVYHIGFFQAALAAMVLAAVLVREVPAWAGPGRVGRFVTAAGGLLALTLLSAGVIVRSNSIRGEQTQTVGLGGDQFLAFNSAVDPIGVLVDWTSKCLSSAPPQAKLLVVPEGLAINFLSKHVSPVVLHGGADPEKAMLEILRNAPPEYIVLITRKETNPGQYGAPGNPGFYLMQWIEQNYTTAGSWGEPFSDPNSKGARIMRRKEIRSATAGAFSPQKFAAVMNSP